MKSNVESDPDSINPGTLPPLLSVEEWTPVGYIQVTNR